MVFNTSFGNYCYNSGFLGAKISFHINEKLQLTLLGLFIVISALLILFFKPIKFFENIRGKSLIPLGTALGTLGGFIGGLLGLGGGSIVNPIMLFLGLEPRIVSSASAVMVLFSSFSGWLVYFYHSSFNWKEGFFLVGVAITGSWIGSQLAKNLPKEILRKLIAIFLLFIGTSLLLKAL